MFKLTSSVATPFGAASTADRVLAGIDLSGKVFLITGCDSGIGLSIMHALAANGAGVIGLARTLAKAADACAAAGPTCKPVGCDLADLMSVKAAADAVLNMERELDGVIANAGVAHLASPRIRYGVDMHFLVNYLAHNVLIERLLPRVREHGGRIVVNSTRGVDRMPADGIDFANLDGAVAYEPAKSYVQSKFALALYAKELSRRLSARGIAVNTVDPGRTRNTAIDRHRPRTLWSRLPLRGVFMKTPQQAAATHALLLASPRLAGITGEYWRDCHSATSHPLLDDRLLAERLMDTSQRIVANAGAANTRSFKVAA